MACIALAAFLPILTEAQSTPQPDPRFTKLLEDLLPGIDAPDISAIQRAEKSADKRLIAPLIDRAKFAKSREELLALVSALRKLTGEKFAAPEQAWPDAMVWYGKQTGLQPPPGYTAWKGELYGRIIDPRFRFLLYKDAPAAVRVGEVTWGGVKLGGIPALVNPKTLDVAEADYLPNTDAVFGVSIDGDHRAYPLRILDWHEMANDVVGGKPVALAYCTLCGAGILFDATAGKASYKFGSSGLLFRSNKLMFDDSTYTLWNQITGEPVLGKLVGKGIKLKILPLVLTSWGEWKRQHPDTKVLDPNTRHKRPYRPGAAYGPYFGSPDTMFPVWQQSRRFPKKARIFALRVDGAPKAYPLDELNQAGGIANDALGGKNVVVVYRDAVGQVPLPPGWKREIAKSGNRSDKIEFANDLTIETARAVLKKKPSLIKEMTAEFLLAMPIKARLALLKERTQDQKQGAKAGKEKFPADLRNEVAVRGLIGETRAYERGGYTFSASNSGSASKAGDSLTDEQGRLWRITEEALVGPGEERLPRLGGHLAYWFGWFAFFPRTEVFEAP
jgi:hypothetical protein